MTDGKTRFTFPDGSSQELELNSGDAIPVDAMSHAVENTGDAEMRVLLVEMKQ